MPKIVDLNESPSVKVAKYKNKGYEFLSVQRVWRDRDSGEINHKSGCWIPMDCLEDVMQAMKEVAASEEAVEPDWVKR